MAREQSQPKVQVDDMEEWIYELLLTLQHDNPKVRHDGWVNLVRAACAQRDIVSQLPDDELADIIMSERDSVVLSCADRVMSILAMYRSGIARTLTMLQPTCLGGWMWNDFHDQSRVMRVSDPERLRRDEEAVITIARSLSHAEFPDTKFRCIDPDNFAPPLRSVGRRACHLFRGRLCLYGKEAVENWAEKTGASRYHFGLQYRPSNLGRGKLDPNYHSILCEGRGEPFRTSEQDGKRTDYGIVRRYVVTRNGQQIVVVHIAGCSSLGTQAAAEFAAHTMFCLDMEGGLLPIPEDIDVNSYMEALIEVTADIDRAEFGWNMRDLELLHLRVGDFVWDGEAKQWNRKERTQVTVVFPSEAAKQNYQTEYHDAKILIDGNLVKFQAGSENHRMCVALMMWAAKHGGVISLEKLGQERWIWKDGKTRTVKQVRDRLTNANIRKKLNSAYVVEKDTCRVLPKVAVTVDESRPNKPR